MAAPMSTADADLGELLAQQLPAGVKVTVRHVSSTPTPCAALFAAPPGEEPEATFCVNHFLSVSIHKGDTDNGPEIIVFGIEILVYSTAHLTTIFVSKADSTGYLHLLQTASKVSLLRLISETFLSFLVRTHQRPGVRLVLSLFARAQNQYLFPGSIHNTGKHVLDDRGLIKWWCRVADPILREYEPESAGSQEKGLLDRAMESARSSATAFLIVPGCDKFETRGFFPPAAKSDGDKERPRWVNSFPVRQLCDNPEAPPRCLIPRLPDDPKTRFLTDLDDELPERMEADQKNVKSPGQWRSVRSLEQFWEMMSFRQECSAGRLVGFLWLVINPPGLVNSVQMASSRMVSGDGKESMESKESQNSPDERVSDPGKAPLQSNDTVQPVSSSQLQEAQQTPDSRSFYWPEAGRGQVVLSETDYKTAIDFLLTQDFDNEEVSISSTKAWAEQLASLADQLWVGKHVEGRNTTAGKSAPQSSATTNLMDSGLVKKRKKNDQGQGGSEEHRAAETEDGAKTAPGSDQPTSGVNMLSTNLIRKKKKT